MVSLRTASQMRGTLSTARILVTSELCRAVPQLPRPRAQFSFLNRQYSTASLFTSSDALQRHTVSEPPTLHALPLDLSKRTRTIPDTISLSTLTAISQALEGYLPPTSPSKIPSHATFLIHFGHCAQHPSDYLADGTDNFHYPGPPYNSRVWAGGSITWDAAAHKRAFTTPILGGDGYIISTQLQCSEAIISATQSSSKNVKVRTKRIYGGSHPDSTASQTQTRHTSKDLANTSAITEYRDLVFLPYKTPEEARAHLARPDRIIAPTLSPDFSHTLTPQQALLAEFSCLTHNAHRIHLDRGYAQVEGFRNLVVHGPLSLYLMITHLENVTQGRIVQFDYRNLAPLFCDEEMTICLRRQTKLTMEEGEVANEGEGDGKEQIWDVWITGSKGGYAVKGTAKVLMPVGESSYVGSDHQSGRDSTAALAGVRDRFL